MFRLTEDLGFYLYTGKVNLRRGCLSMTMGSMRVALLEQTKTIKELTSLLANACAQESL